MDSLTSDIINLSLFDRSTEPGALCSEPDTEERTVLLLDVPDKVVLVQRLARDLVAGLKELVLPAVLVDVLSEPSQEGLEQALREAPLHVREVLLGLVVELGRQKVPKGVGREVPYGPQGPVDVLQAALEVAVGRDAKVFLGKSVPDGRDLGGRHRPVDHLLFDLEPQHYMEVVGDLVGFDPDERGRDHVDGLVPVLQGDLAKGREGPLHLGHVMDPEGPAAADHVLPYPRLRFMDAQGGARAHGCMVVLLERSLLVEPVPGLVDAGKEPGPEVVGVVPGRYPDVLGLAHGERMHGHVEPAGVEAVAQVLDDLGEEGPLGLDVEVAGHEGPVGSGLLGGLCDL